jgi:hypothetical protein
MTGGVQIRPASSLELSMFTHHYGDAILEWVVLGAIVIAVIGGVLYTVSQSIASKLQGINVQIGS